MKDVVTLDKWGVQPESCLLIVHEYRNGLGEIFAERRFHDEECEAHEKNQAIQPCGFEIERQTRESPAEYCGEPSEPGIPYCERHIDYGDCQDWGTDR